MEKHNDKTLKIILLILIIALIIACGYIITEKVDLCETVKNESYSAGARDGTLFWNNVIIKTVNENGEIPYIVNNTIQTIPIKQLCESIQ